MERNAANGFSIEVVQSWKGQVLDSDLVSLERPRRLAIGEVGRFLLPIGESFDVLAIEDGRATLTIPARATALVEEGESTREIDAQSADRVFVLGAHTTIELTIADMTFLVRSVAKEQSKFGGGNFDLASLRWIGAAFAFHVAILATFFFLPPHSSALASGFDADATRYIQVHLDALAITPPPPAPGTTSESSSAPSSSEGGGSAPTPAVAGGPGHRDVRAPRTIQSPVTADDVRSFSAFDVLARAFANDQGELSPYTVGEIAEGEGGPGDALIPGGPGSGIGGFDMHDAGRGTCTGDHCAQGTIDQGGLGTHDGHGDHPGPGLGTREGRVPTIRACTDPSCTTVVGGSLTREQIRGVIARHRNEVRFCYEQALIGHPELEGHVNVGFQVAADGHVSQSSASGMSGVDSCVARAVERWQFPASSSPTIVNYPFVMESTSSQ
jgi:hypothetical protein